MCQSCELLLGRLEVKSRELVHDRRVGPRFSRVRAVPGDELVRCGAELYYNRITHECKIYCGTERQLFLLFGRHDRFHELKNLRRFIYRGDTSSFPVIELRLIKLDMC